MTVHFICDGNIYRSRLAQCYFNSKKPKGLKCFSSGTIAGNDLKGPISWLAQRIITKNKLSPYMSFMFQKTSKDLLKRADYTIFMDTNIYEFCKKNFGFNPKNYEIWHIEDTNKFDSDLVKIKATEETFEKIKKKVDYLIIKLQKS